MPAFKPSTVLKDTRLEDQITMCIDAEWEGSVAHWLVKCSVRLDPRIQNPRTVLENAGLKDHYNMWVGAEWVYW
ncbi:hypothetical protein CEXT_232931 [Caerostris extrusa]|uniref:Uncharacterized protein n=1 Tax=Caerostris extrusa TaxID=172846 RepID=A0AAV4XDB6_CAEEX|nr:hypothetical protein CEXT_232931 [Caerostris extrusa]